MIRKCGKQNESPTPKTELKIKTKLTIRYYYKETFCMPKDHNYCNNVNIGIISRVDTLIE